MGYIYLMPEDYSADWESKTNIYIFRNTGVNIPFSKDDELSNKLDEMQVMNKRFWSAKNDHDFFFKYPCDAKDGYLFGIELELPSTKFMKFIRDEVYRVYQINWQDKEFNLVLFDREKKIFSPNNKIYPFYEEGDVYVILAEEEKDFSSIVALIYSRNDIYPLEYLITPQFLV